MSDYRQIQFGDTYFEIFTKEAKKLRGDVTIDGYDYPLKDIMDFANYINELRGTNG